MYKKKLKVLYILNVFKRLIKTALFFFLLGQMLSTGGIAFIYRKKQNYKSETDQSEKTGSEGCNFTFNFVSTTLTSFNKSLEIF